MAWARGKSLVVAALSHSVIYCGAAVGRGFEELSVGERGHRHQIITQRKSRATPGKDAFINR